jgi:hypothetical protein
MRRTQQQIAREAKATVVPATRYGVESLKRLGILGLILAVSAIASPFVASLLGPGLLVLVLGHGAPLEAPTPSNSGGSLVGVTQCCASR